MNWYKLAQTYYTEEVAKNPNTDPKILAAILSRGKDDYVSWGAAQNPSTPPEALAAILSRGKDDRVSRGAAQNPSTPPEALAAILSRGKDDYVSYYAARNPSYLKYIEKIKAKEKQEKNEQRLLYNQLRTQALQNINPISQLEID